jgi:DNA-binding transcriptional ArsR family regulator
VKKREEEFTENLVQTLKNPTRASIFYQLALTPESTATEIAKSLGEDVDVVYYHLKLLRKSGLVSKPKIVAQENYLEKYYSIPLDFKERLSRSVKELAARERELKTDEFREMVIALFTVVQSLLASSTRRLEKADARIINKLREEDSIESKIIFCSKERYDQLLEQLREATHTDVLETFDPSAGKHVIVIIALPRLEDNKN